jgi:hypothetical protein
MGDTMDSRKLVCPITGKNIFGYNGIVTIDPTLNYESRFTVSYDIEFKIPEDLELLESDEFVNDLASSSDIIEIYPDISLTIQSPFSEEGKVSLCLRKESILERMPAGVESVELTELPVGEYECKKLYMDIFYGKYRGYMRLDFSEIKSMDDLAAAVDEELANNYEWNLDQVHFDNIYVEDLSQKNSKKSSVKEGGRDGYLKKVKKDGRSLEKVPTKFKDTEICLTAVAQSGDALEYVPEDLKSREICQIAVKRCGTALQYVPDILRDREICLEAVTDSAYALEYVPVNNMDREICLVAVNNSGCALQYVPPNFIDHDLCMAAVSQSGYALQYVPENLIDQETVMAAVNQGSYDFQFVPEAFRDREICLKAVAESGDALQYVPEAIKDREVCLAAVKENGRSLQYVPATLKDQEICLLAVKNNGDIDDVPEKFRGLDVYLEVVKNRLSWSAPWMRDSCFEIVPEELRDEVKKILATAPSSKV